MVKRSEYDQWVIDWIESEKAKGRKCFDVKKVVNSYYVYYQTTRYNAETKKREKVTSYIGKLVQGQGVVEPRGERRRNDIVTPARYGLGIDTGGTYTDAVIIDLDDYSVVAKSKHPTTHHDLSIGLHNVVGSVLFSSKISPSEISLVGISTTLATNSILEGHGGEVGLILIGWNPTSPVNFGEKRQAFVKGGYDVRGRVIDSLSQDEVIAAIKNVSEGVDAIAISGLFANVNASQERKVKKLASELTGLPTVAGHELSAVLGIDLRAETAVLNGRLIPILSKFFDDVENTFHGNGIKAPIMVYKGDGSVMTLEQARLYPVETILSGPAASSMGGKILSGENDCIVVDIGGTSTDIALVEGGFPQIQFEGARIGNWRTRVKAVDMYTVALGGDSRISIDKSKFSFGPDRVVPLCSFSEEYPEIIEKMDSTNITDYYCSNETSADTIITEKEARVLKAMNGRGPMSTMEVMNATDGLWMIQDELRSLVKKGMVSMASLTPTDIMVASDMFELGNHGGARSAVGAVARKMGMTEGQTIKVIMEELRIKVSEAVLSKLINESMKDWRNRETAMFIRRMSLKGDKEILSIDPHIKIPIIGIGAPSKYMMDDMDQRLGTKVLFPDDYDVGNAIGAVSSKVVKSMVASVTPTHDFRYKVDIPYLGPSYYTHLESAVSAAKSSLESFLKAEVKKNGGQNIITSSKVKTFLATEGGMGDWEDDELARTVNYIEINSRAIGDPPEV